MGERSIGPYELDTVVQGDWLEVLRQLPDESVHCVVTSPPYWGLRDYGTASWEGGEEGCDHKGPPVRTQAGFNSRYFGKDFASDKQGEEREPMGQTCSKCGAVRIDAQLGLERTPEEYVSKIVEGFREVRRVLRSDGTCWVNLGDSYAGSGRGRNGDGTHSEGDDKQHTNRGSVAGSLLPAGLHESARLAGNIGRAWVKPPDGLKPKDLCGIPWRVALALQADGWWLRQDIIWSKPNPMPESVTDRCTKAHEYIFLLTKRERYYYDAGAVKEPLAQSTIEWGNGKDGWGPSNPNHATADGVHGPSLRGEGRCGENGSGRNKRSVWEITSKPFPEAHFATFPPEIPATCIKAGTSEQGCCRECGAPWERMVEKSGGTIGKSWHNHEDDLGRGQQSGDSGKLFSTYKVETLGWQPTCSCAAGEPVPCVVMDPFSGAGTVRMVAMKLGRHFIGAELNPEYIKLGYDRTWAEDAQPSLFEPRPEQFRFAGIGN